MPFDIKHRITERGHVHVPDSLLRSRPRERIQFSNLSLSTLSRVSVAIPWPQIIQYSTVQYSTVQYSTVQYSTVPGRRSWWRGTPARGSGRPSWTPWSGSGCRPSSGTRPATPPQPRRSKQIFLNTHKIFLNTNYRISFYRIINYYLRNVWGWQSVQLCV